MPRFDAHTPPTYVTPEGQSTQPVRIVDFDDTQDSANFIAWLFGIDPDTGEQDDKDRPLVDPNTVVSGDRTDQGVEPLTVPDGHIIVGTSSGVGTRRTIPDTILGTDGEDVIFIPNSRLTIPWLLSLR